MIVTFGSIEGLVPSGGVMAIWEFAQELARLGHEVHVVHERAFGRPTLRSVDDAPWFTFDAPVIHHFDVEASQVVIPGSQAAFGIFSMPPSHLGEPLMWVQAFGIFHPTQEQVIFGSPCPKVCTSTFLRSALIEVGTRPDQVFHVPYGLRLDKYRLIQPLEDRPPRVAMIWNSNPIKGGPDGVAALARAKTLLPELEAVVFGVEAPPPDLPDWVDYRLDPPQDELVDEILNRSRVFVLPSLEEGFGLVAVEAMACGCALAATDCAGPRDYALPDETALVSPVGDPGGLARSIVRLVQDDAVRERIARAGMAKVAELSWPLSARRLEAVLEQYLAEPARYQHAETELSFA